MRVLCLNAWGGTLAGALLPWLAGCGADVICLQEVVHSPATSNDWLTYRDGDHVLAQRANLYADVARVLPDHAGTFCPAAEGVLWDGDQSVPSQWGLATFVRRSLPVIGQVHGFVHKDFSPEGYGDHPRARVAHGVRLYDAARRRTVSITQMHGLRDLNGKGNTPDRLRQAQRLMTLADTLSQPTDIRIICGDFNTLPGSETQQLLQAAGFAELVTGRRHHGTRTSHYTKPGRFADYMFIDRPQAVLQFNVVTMPEVSDHCPLMLEL